MEKIYRIPIVPDVGRQIRILRYRVRLPFFVQNKDSQFRRLPCILDTGADFTYIPRYLADPQKIIYTKSNKVTVRSVIGESKKKIFASPITFSLEADPDEDLRFPTTAYFSSYKYEYVLLAFSDLHEFFHIRTESDSLSPVEAIVLEKRLHRLSEPPIDDA